ncbi:MAG: hypothetical protein NDI94_02185 [Candidatus Woesearchaeota archaeon]|nr:hypothetical protein [Candidatus Woesearchaeota archaeon]
MAEKMIIRAFQLGLGIVDITKEEVQKLVKELKVDENTKEGRKLVASLIKNGKEASVKLEKKIEQHSKKLSSNFVTKKDLDRLEKKIDALAKKKKR